MVMTLARHEARTAEPDRSGAADLFDSIARHEMGISGTEFLERWDRGDFTNVDWDDVQGLVETAMAVPLVR